MKRRIGIMLCVAAGLAGGCKRGDAGGARMMDAASMAPGGYGGEMAMEPMVAQAEPTAFNEEDYNAITDNDFITVADDPRSTFSVDVDTASYSNTRRFLQDGSLPPADAVRIEELINYFEYAYPQPKAGRPFSVTSEVSDCPWKPGHRLVHLGVQGKHVKQDKIPARNLVFLLDVSGSMESADKLPLLRQGMMMLAGQLRANDHVSIVVYAGASGVVLQPTNEKRAIKRALAKLSAGGSTAGAEGIELAYAMAEKHFVKGGINRVILATDGDFNVGPSSQGELVKLIEQKRETGVFLSVLGFGTGNLNDAMMESIADHGNGNYAYIDSAREAKKVLVDQASSTLVAIAKDVKLQVEFNPTQVEAYRLIGYENRVLAHKDFNDDTKDAGEIGAGHTVTALYEIVPIGAGEAVPSVDALKYQKSDGTTAAASADELMTVKIRYKQPDGDKSSKLSFPVSDDDRGLSETTDNFRFSAAVATFGMMLRESEHKGKSTFGLAHHLAKGALGGDRSGLRREFLKLVRAAASLKREKSLRQAG